MLAPFIPPARQAITQPREAAVTLMGMGVPREALWPSFALLVLLSAILTYLGSGAATGEQIVFTPFHFVLVSALAGAASVFAIWKIGGAMGGTGTFENTLLLMVFLQALLFTGQLIEFGIFLIAPPIASLFSIVLIVWAFFVNLNFVAALHGFSSLLRSLGCLLLASFGVALVVVSIMAFLGIQMPGAA
ncbi:MAG: hypothetical protein OXQ92_01795 [Boseongicola sp.]|nr:hypothetical protein [Boseongicola sp.]